MHEEAQQAQANQAGPDSTTAQQATDWQFLEATVPRCFVMQLRHQLNNFTVKEEALEAWRTLLPLPSAA